MHEQVQVFPAVYAWGPCSESGTSSCQFPPSGVRIVPEAQIAQLQVDTFDLVYPNGAEGKGDGKCDVVGRVKGKRCWGWAGGGCCDTGTPPPHPHSLED